MYPSAREALAKKINLSGVESTNIIPPMCMLSVIYLSDIIFSSLNSHTRI